jgi:predicted phosphodiesterase
VQRFLILSDLQVPDEDPKAVEAIAGWARRWKPDEVLCVGDEFDSPEAARWNKGYATEYAGTLDQNRLRTVRTLTLFREGPLGRVPFHLMRSNHGDRIRKYLERYAPALAGLPELQYEKLLRLDELGITYHEAPYEWAPGWLLAHGDEGSLIQTSGGTAMNLAQRWGKSVVCGHTHRMGIQHKHHVLGGRVTSHLFGVEVGHLMDMRKADYLRAGHGNWQQGFGVAYVEGRRVHVQTVPIIGRSFVVDGKEVSW